MAINSPAKPPSPEPGSGVYVTVENLLQWRYLARDISLDTRKKSSAQADGDSKTHFRGRGMEFSEVRPYQAGDDIRNIDWRVTARTLQTYTKLFQEERERPVYLVVDQRSPMFFGSGQLFKSVYAAQLAAVIGWSAVNNNDRLGALVVGDQQQEDLRARRGKHAILALVNRLAEFNQRLTSPVGTAASTDMEAILTEIRRVARPGSAVFIISDFHDFDDSCTGLLAQAARHIDVTLFKLFDPLERQLPPRRELTLSNNQARLTVSTAEPGFLDSYRQAFDQRHQQVQHASRQAGCRYTQLNIHEPLDQQIRELFVSRRERRKRSCV